MKIPRSLTLQSQQTDISSTDHESKTWISASEAAALLKIRTSSVISRIRKGTLTGTISSDLPFTVDGKENYVVLLQCLPAKAQYAYITSKLKKDEFVSSDLASPRSTFGDVWISQFINVAQLIRDADLIRRRYHSTGSITEKLEELAGSYGISLSTLYRFTGQRNSAEISLLYTDPIYLQNRLPKTMCLFSCDLAYSLYLDQDRRYSQNKILKELIKKQNQVSCKECPYHPEAERSGYDSDIPVCVKFSETMVVPNNRKTINRLLAHIPPELLLYCRRGYREWRAKYGLFSMREKPLLVNENFQGDHHVMNIFVSTKIKKIKNGKTYEKVIAVRPVLTAWMDTASGYIVGWVISILPNSDTIAEAFCRACVPTVGDIASGLPRSVTVDCGRDYKSKLLGDPCCNYTVNNWDDSDACLNRRFSGMGVLRSLGCDIFTCLPYHPQSKSIERFFGTLDSYISQYKGYCYKSVEDRPDDFAKRLSRMLENNELLSAEVFAEKFAAEILPSYHGAPDSPPSDSDLPGWILSYESMSPSQRYQSMEKARRTVPDWKTMSILKRHYYPDQAKVGAYGIRFQNVFYKDDALADIPGKWVSILCHSFTPPYAPSSITVIYNNKAICEAFPVRRNSFVNESDSVLSEASDTQNRPAKEMKRAVSRISRMANSVLPDNKSKPELSQKDQLREVTYGQTVNEMEESSDRVNPISASLSSLQNDPAFPASMKSYDRAYELLFGSID